MLRMSSTPLILIALLHALSLQLYAQTATTPEIVASANGTATVTPDRATVFVEVRTQGATAQEASARNTPIMNAVLAALRGMGYGADRISTRGYVVQPTYRWDSGVGQSISTGFAAHNAVTVRVDGVQRVGETLDVALAAGATRVGVHLTSSEFERARRQALERAVANATQDAEALARAAGGTLGELILITTDARASRDEGQVVAIAPPPGESTPIDAGEQTITASVQGRWKFLKR